jgi:uncharacterized repeat protein (TIGR03803 family)
MSRIRCIALAAAVLPALAGRAAAAPPAVTTLYSFTDHNGDGAYPQAGVIIGKNGALYGTTLLSAGFATGTVFELIPPSTQGAAWTEVILHNFTGQPGQAGDGAYPFAGVVQGSNRVLYGATDGGGQSNGGTVFELIPPSSPGPWREKMLHSFSGKRGDGAGPLASLVVGPKGVLYGTTSGGGAAHAGTVFQLTPPASPGGAWTETVLYSFTGQNGDGKTPNAGVVIGAGGALYGTTQSGGTSNNGTVFELTPPASGGAWTETVLYSFAGYYDGLRPLAGLVLNAAGALFGTTNAGGASQQGTVFQLTPPASSGGPWTETLLYSFTGQNGDGSAPFGSLVFNSTGVLFGTTFGGGAASLGTLFQLNPPAMPGGAWTESVLHSFTAQSGDGANPTAGMALAPSGILYGTTSNGGAAGYGTVFQLTP